MSTIDSILFKSLVIPFYKQNAGLFIFAFIVLFGAVGVVDGAGLLHFHYSLIIGILKNFLFLLPVLLIWILFAKKNEQFVLNTLGRADYRFIHTLSLLDQRKLFLSMLRVQTLLFVPVIFYSLLILYFGFAEHNFIKCIIIVSFIAGVCMLAAQWYTHKIKTPGWAQLPTSIGSGSSIYNRSYWFYFVRYLMIDRKLIFAGIKIYCCGILYLMIVNQIPFEYDLRMIFIFFSLGILGHGLLIHQFRDLEELRFRLMRTLPIPLFKRFLQYLILYFVILIPELLTISLLTPKYLHRSDSLVFALLSIVLLLFLNSILFVRFFKMKDYLKIILLLFFILYAFVLSGMLATFCLILLVVSLVIFIRHYYSFEMHA